MPTLELVTPAPDLQSLQNVRAPGGYESICFEARSADGHLRIAAAWHYGYPRDSSYIRRYLLYRLLPTRVSPPLPMDYPSWSLLVCAGGARVRRMFQRRRGHEPPGYVDGDDGATRLEIDDVQLLFRPRASPPCPAIDIGPHHLRIVAPRCDVEGTMGARRLAGLGCRMHRWGTRWPGETAGLGALVTERATAQLQEGTGAGTDFGGALIGESFTPSRLASWLGLGGRG